MQLLKAYIIDDELQSQNFLHKMLQQHFPEIEIAGEASTVEEALKGIKQCNPDIVFLDIQIKNETGFDLLKQLHKINFNLIFTTAFDRYAIKAFRFNAIDYLLKPIVAEELIEAVNKVKQKTATAQAASKQQVEQLYDDLLNPKKVHDKIAVPTNDGFVVINVNDIVYCHANSNYTEFYFNDKKTIVSSYSLKQYDDLLTPQSFFRTHRSYLINLKHVQKYRRGIGGEIVMSNGDEVELSRNNKEAFLELFKTA